MQTSSHPATIWCVMCIFNVTTIGAVAGYLAESSPWAHLLQINTTADDGLEKFPEAGSAANIGIMLVRKGALALAKVRHALDLFWDVLLSESALVARRCQDLHVRHSLRMFQLGPPGRSGMRCCWRTTRSGIRMPSMICSGKP